MPLPSQTQLMLPLLESLSEHGGAARPRDLYAELADKLNLPAETRESTITIGDQQVNEFQRRVRWTRQTAVLKGLIAKGERSLWSLTETANAKLGNMVRGTILTFAISDDGAFLWANAEDALTVVEPGSVDLVLSSPPYPLLNPRNYGNPRPEAWVDWMLSFCDGFSRVLSEKGSIMLNVGRTWRRGEPTQELHIERLLIALEDQLGIHLLQMLQWSSPTKLPTPAPWVARTRLRVTPSVEPILWLSKNPFAHGNNRNLLRPYSSTGLESIRKPRISKRPCGIQFGKNSFVDRGGSIPPSLITAVPNGAEEMRYRKAMCALGQEPHPAVLPAAVARFGILLATEPGDLVYDPFAGSGTVPVEAIKLGRRAIASERSRLFLDGAMVRARCEGLQLEQLAA